MAHRYALLNSGNKLYLSHEGDVPVIPISYHFGIFFLLLSVVFQFVYHVLILGLIVPESWDHC